MAYDMGGKIKAIASAFAALDVLAVVISGIIVMFSNMIIGIVIMAIGIFVAWLFWLFTYAYGHLVDSVDTLSENVRNIQGQLCRVEPERKVPTTNNEKIPAWKRVEMEKQNQEIE